MMVDSGKVSKLADRLFLWFSQNARDLPWRRTHDPYGVYVSEIMLQQTQVKTVIPYWERWMQEFPTIAAVAQASPARIHKLWEGLGYYTRVRNLQRAAQTIVREHGGTFPNDFEQVLALPGIGRYTAGAICSIAFNQPTPLLDGNVIRVLTRIFGIAENPKEKTTNARLWQLAEALVATAHQKSGGDADSGGNGKGDWSTKHCSALNQSLMELGALICTPRQPQCAVCPAKRLCVASREDRVLELPNLGKRESATARRFIAFAIECNGKLLVRQRPAGTVNGHLWEFPNLESDAGLAMAASVAAATSLFKKHLGVAPGRLEPLASLKHSITRYRITLDAFMVGVKRRPAGVDGMWKAPGELRELAFTAAHKKLASLAVQRILSNR
jgi:A/G-specific adenine glycosylase